MNFDDAIKAHSAWKFKLQSYIQKPDGSLKPDSIALDNQCDLGKWIYGDGKSFSNLPDYEALRSEHAKFHKCASGIVRRADSGENVGDEIALGANSEFAKISGKVVSLIMEMKIKTKKAG